MKIINDYPREIVSITKRQNKFLVHNKLNNHKDEIKLFIATIFLILSIKMLMT